MTGLTERETLLWRINCALERGTVDELAAFDVIADKVMGKGRETYGPAILSNDPRNMVAEGGDEGIDAVFYFALEIVKRTRAAATAPLLTNLIWDLRELAFEGFSRGWDGLDQRDAHAQIDRVINEIKTVLPMPARADHPTPISEVESKR